MPQTLALLVASEGATLSLTLLLVFGMAKVMAELCERLGQPAIVGEILAGVLIGPGVLGWVAPGTLLGHLAELGAMMLLFHVGLDVRVSSLLKVGWAATLVACSGVAVPFALGWWLAGAWGLGGPESAFVAASMVATSVGITARVLASRGLLAEKASRIILAAAVIDDVLGLLVLSVVSGIARGRFDARAIATTAVLAIAFVCAAAFWGGRVAGRMIPAMRRTMRVGEGEFAIAMVAMFGFAFAAVYTGVAPIVGAFLAGAALGETAEPRVRDLACGASELLVPFFVAGIGLNVDLSIFGSARTLAFAGAIVLAAVVSKFIGCGIASLGMGWADSVRVGVGMVPRGEVGMVVAQVGLAAGIVSRTTYGVLVAMAVGTTLVAPPLLGLAFREAPAQTTIAASAVSELGGTT